MSAAPFQNVLVVVDGSESGIKAAEFAIRLTHGSTTRLTAIAVVDADTLRKLMSAHILVEEEMREIEGGLEQTHNRHLEYVAQLARKAKVTCETVLRKGVVHSAVLAEQKARDADIIVIGEFHSTFTKRDLSARERQLILDEAHCPVLVVK